MKEMNSSSVKIPSLLGVQQIMNLLKTLICYFFKNIVFTFKIIVGKSF